MPDVKEATSRYVSKHEPRDAPPLDELLRAATRRRRRKGAVAGAAVVASAAAIVGAVWVGHHGSPTAPAAGDPHVSAPSKPRTDGVPTATAAPKPVMTVKMEGAKIATYGLPTLTQFANSSLIDRVVAGTVTKVDYEVSDDGSETVFTVMTVHTKDLMGQRGGRDITVRELGGVVPLREVRRDIEAHTGPVAESQLDDLVDFTYDSTPHPRAGDTELFFLAKNPAGDMAQYASMARLRWHPSNNRFTWAGEIPNTRWVKGLSRADVVANFRSHLSVG